MDLLEPASPALAVPPDEIAALDATLTVADWPLVQRLWKLGFSNASVYHLLRLRARYRRYGPETDGLATDPAPCSRAGSSAPAASTKARNPAAAALSAR